MKRLDAVVRLLRTSRGKPAGGAAIGRAADAADRLTGRRHSARISAARGAAERALRRI